MFTVMTDEKAVEGLFICRDKGASTRIINGTVYFHGGEWNINLPQHHRTVGLKRLVGMIRKVQVPITVYDE